MLAALNHPNIAQIYGFERAEGARALVMELVEGPTLADRIAKGPIPVDEALPIARQIAEALEAAHEQTIIHRDLKPANIKLRADGTVKVLDFGLAKALEPAAAGGIDIVTSPTITSPAMMTGAGVLLGTAAYMSPEQARGKPVDRRADIWAFGCVLYEMLTGRRVFDGEDVSLTLSQILQRDPALDALPVDVPARVRQVVQLCLKKPLKERMTDIGAVRLMLEGAFDTTAVGVRRRRDCADEVATGGPVSSDCFCRRRARRRRRLATDARSRSWPAPRRAVCSARSGQRRSPGRRRRSPRPRDFSTRDAPRVLGGQQAAPSRAGPSERCNAHPRHRGCARAVFFAGRPVDRVSSPGSTQANARRRRRPDLIRRRAKPMGC